MPILTGLALPQTNTPATRVDLPDGLRSSHGIHRSFGFNMRLAAPGYLGTIPQSPVVKQCERLASQRVAIVPRTGCRDASDGTTTGTRVAHMRFAA